MKCRLIVFAIAFSAVTQAYAGDIADSVLVGCWRFESGTSYLADGRTIAAQTKCTTEYSKDRITSRCVGDKGESVITYTYTIPTPGVYEAEMLSHSGMPSAVGSLRRVEYDVKNDGLTLITYPQTTKPAPLNAAVKFVSKSRRDTKSCRPD
jgi:hypothetical protein